MKPTILLWLLAVAVFPAAAQSFPEGDVAAYIDAVDAVMLPVNCKARMAVLDTYDSGEERSSEGFFLRRDNKVVWVATAPAAQKNFALLRNEDVFYQRFATTNKVVKTSATANARGGETSNLDLTRFNTNLDYAAAFLGQRAGGGQGLLPLRAAGPQPQAGLQPGAPLGREVHSDAREKGLLRGVREGAQVLHGHPG